MESWSSYKKQGIGHVPAGSGLSIKLPSGLMWRVTDKLPEAVDSMDMFLYAHSIRCEIVSGGKMYMVFCKSHGNLNTSHA